MKLGFRCKKCGCEFVCPTCGRPYGSAKRAARLAIKKRKDKLCGECKKNFAIAVATAMAKRGN